MLGWVFSFSHIAVSSLLTHSLSLSLRLCACKQLHVASLPASTADKSEAPDAGVDIRAVAVWQHQASTPRGRAAAKSATSHYV